MIKQNIYIFDLLRIASQAAGPIGLICGGWGVLYAKQIRNFSTNFFSPLLDHLASLLNKRIK